MPLLVLLAGLAFGPSVTPQSPTTPPPVPSPLPGILRVLFENTSPLTTPRSGRLPLFVLPISHALAGIDDLRTETLLRELERRGIGYTVAWNPADLTNSVREALRIARYQQALGMPVAADATSCLMSFHDGTDATLHVDDAGVPFAETSFGGRLGCPFALDHRLPVIAKRVENFVQAYRRAGLPLDFVCADWEVDGPLEWNGAWASSRRCRRCRDAIPGIDDFRTFQRRVREVRSSLQREAFAQPIRRAFPGALVGNYGIHPHDGFRRWYDYFEKEVAPDSGIPLKADGRARYREWAHEFAGTGFTFANPVLYTWYRLFAWYEFADPDYRWFYNLLLEGSSAGRHTPPSTPLVPFVHWTTTDPPPKPDPAVRQLDADRYRELLWHLLLRGHDSFFLWCLPEELATELRLLHPVYAESLAHREFLDQGEPVNFEVPAAPGAVISGLRLGNRVLARRTDFGNDSSTHTLPLSSGGVVAVPPAHGLQLLPVLAASGAIEHGGRRRFPIGSYELPASDADLQAMARAGVNLVLCQNRADLDRAHAVGILGWMPLPVQAGATDDLRARVQSVVDHPALAVWEGPDEIVWNFTAYSGLAQTAGFTRDDWQRQTPTATAHAAREAARTLPRLREGIWLVRELDPRHRPFWINEAADSDAAYVRAYLDVIDVTGCDYYAVRSTGTDLLAVGRLVDRWTAIGRGKPVWMVLQAFSWHALKPGRARLYPTFEESRFMAYDALVRGARGLFFWGSWTIDDPEFRRNLHRLTSELAGLEGFLVGEELRGVSTRCIAEVFDPPGGNVRVQVRRVANEFLVLLVNEDPHRHLAVEVTGLRDLEGRLLHPRQAAPTTSPRVDRGTFITRLQPHEVALLSSDPAAFSSRPTTD